MQFSRPAIKRWHILSGSVDCEKRLIDELKVSDIAARLLVNRGITDSEHAYKFLNPTLENCHDAFLLPDCRAAVGRILLAFENKETIFIHGDYDVDGITSCSIWTRALRRLGAAVIPYIPHRIRDGYGIHEPAVDDAKKQGARLIITCDCGIQSHHVVEYARTLGIDVIITDHHEPGDTLPNAVAVVNPKRSDSQYPFRNLSGAGVSFKLLEALVCELGANINTFRTAYLDLVTLGTVADVVPLHDENRILVANGLPLLMKSRKAGIQALLNVMAASRKKVEPITTKTISFGIAPRINAAGRVDEASLALELLLTDSSDSANEIITKLELHNQERCREQERLIREAEEKILARDYENERILVIAGEAWPGGIMGIAAGRLAEKFNRPVLIVSVDPSSGVCKGSARSPGKLNLHHAFDTHRELFLTCGGHSQAAGCSMYLDKLEEITQALLSYSQEYIAVEDMIPELAVDMELQPHEASMQLWEELTSFEPFGEDNYSPRFVSHNVSLLQKNLTKDGAHVQLRFGTENGSVKGIAFKQADAFSSLNLYDKVDVVYSLEKNSWNGESCAQWIIEDVRTTNVVPKPDMSFVEGLPTKEQLDIIIPPDLARIALFED